MGTVKNIKKELFGFGLKEYKSENNGNFTANDISVNITGNPVPANDITHYRCNMSESLLELSLPKLGRFTVESGKRITVIHNSDTEPEETIPFVYGSCMGALLYQRGIIPLHGSAVLTEKGAAVFLGVSGAGKSTTAAGLAERGYPIICDDISAVKMQGRKAVLIPSNADIKLWKKSLDMLEKSSDSLVPIRNKIEKYYLPLDSGSLKSDYPVNKIYVLHSHNEDIVKISDPLKGRAKFNSAEHHAYRRKFIKGLNRRKEFFSIMMNLLSNAEVKKVTRPKAGYFKELIDRIEQDINNG